MSRCSDGILLLDKPMGISSNAALQRAKRILGVRKAGHSGTLDPFATGLLILLFGQATKVADYLLNSDKWYRCTLRLGQETNTGDREGEVTFQARPDFDQGQLDAALARLRGRIAQIPPMYSAIKRDGQPLYRLARKGVEVPREARMVEIYALEPLSWQNDELVLDIHCSKGTYVRSLAQDLGRMLGCGAHIAELRRMRSGSFCLDAAYTLDELSAAVAEERCPLQAMDLALQDLPAVTLTENTAHYVRQGQGVVIAHAPPPGRIRLYGPQAQFLGLGEVMEDGKVAPRRLMGVN
ncbi:tRNA pseudouridine(55) synthase TruB [Candidatus Igneacidithiobacillus taiwanensis]|uniref:tRNA pseudouridine(55) synthase TruB n=1 Tax=Candidatus Igneacidithiobacillus taiwanensis TaxID=1945924 RepID=UPI002897C605|nr:tRNA pseudouridine(55) synthase TruB [Candidatus Igneacidithiobacillus taiwanensis]MCE5360257.1 tRNA pseudouridine(55) synthase TruB [Acidithiobacillus sp.]